MAQRVSPRYLGLKLAQAAHEAAAALSSATSSLPEALSRGLEAYRARLTMGMLITGAAMAPTLNPKATRCACLPPPPLAAAASLRSQLAAQLHWFHSIFIQGINCQTHGCSDGMPTFASLRRCWPLPHDCAAAPPCCWLCERKNQKIPFRPCPPACSQPDAVERLLVRLLPRPSERTVFTGDVVAFTSPLTVAAAAVAGPAGAAAGLPFGGSSAAAAAAAAASGLGEELQQSTMVRRVAAMPGDELTTGEEEGAESYIIPEVRLSRLIVCLLACLLDWVIV